MDTKQINLKLPSNLLEAAESYAKNFGYRNLQELAAESLREKIFEKNQYDESFSEEEVRLIDELISVSVKSKKIIDENKLSQILLK